MWVMPSSSARCAQLPRAADKVPYYAALKKFRDFLNGTISHLDESDIVFADTKLKKREQDSLENKKPMFADDYDDESRFKNGMLIKQEPGLLPAKKKRGRPKKIKNPEEVLPPDPEKIDANGEIIKKRRGRPKKIHQEQKQVDHEAKEREYHQQQQHQHQHEHSHHLHQQMPHINDNFSNVSNCFSPSMMSPPKIFSNMAPYSQPINDQNYYGQRMSGSPYNGLSTGVGSNKQSPVHLQHYTQSPKSLSLSFTHSDLSSEINTAISSENNLGEPSPRGIEHSDFDGTAAISQQQSQTVYNPDHRSPTATPTHYGVYMRYNDQEQQLHPHQKVPTPMSQATDEHSHHSHSTPPHNHQHTPTNSVSPHPHEKYGLRRSPGQDMASKSLSDLESLVDQIPSISEGGQQRMQQQHSHPGMGDDTLIDKLEINQSYLSNYADSCGSNNANYSSPTSSTQTSGVYGDGYNNSIYSMGSRIQEPSLSQHSKSYTVESLTSSNYTTGNIGNSMNHHQTNHNSNYSNVIPESHYSVPMSVTSSSNSYIFSGLESSLMQRTYSGMVSHHHPSLPSTHPMANPYPYNSSYTNSFDSYTSTVSSLSNSSLHVSQPNYQTYNAIGSSSNSGTHMVPSSYLQQSCNRSLMDLTYDGV